MPSPPFPEASVRAIATPSDWLMVIPCRSLSTTMSRSYVVPKDASSLTPLTPLRANTLRRTAVCSLNATDRPSKRLPSTTTRSTVMPIDRLMLMPRPLPVTTDLLDAAVIGLQQVDPVEEAADRAVADRDGVEAAVAVDADAVARAGERVAAEVDAHAVGADDAGRDRGTGDRTTGGCRW